MTKKEKSKKKYFLNSKNSGETVTGYTFCIGYTYHANCVVVGIYRLSANDDGESNLFYQEDF
jgi:hypothetical protein